MSRHWLGLLMFGIWIGGSGVARAALFVSPDPLDFGDVNFGQSATASATLSAGVGTDVLVIVALRVGGDCSQFQILAPTGEVRVRNSMSQTVMVQFTPTSTGTKSCTIDVTDTGTSTVILSFTAQGKGTAPQIRVDPPSSLSLSFGNTDVGSTSATQSVTATNTGADTLTISSASFTAGGSDYTVTGPSSITLAPTETATWDIACKPSAQGDRGGTFTIASDSTTNKLIDVTLTCTGDQGILMPEPANIDFNAVPRGTTRSMTFVLTNTGNVEVTGITGAIAPTDTGYALDPATVPSTLPPDESTTITVTFSPQDTSDGGPATITLTGSWGSAGTATATVSLAGQVASFAVTPFPTLDFGSFRFDSHPAQTFQVKNESNASISITTAFTPDPGTDAAEYQFAFAKGGASVTPPVSLAPGEQLDITVTPQVDRRIGLVSGHVDVTADSGGTQQLTLTGRSTAAVVDHPKSVDFGLVDINGPPSTQTITIENTGDGTLDIVSLTVQGTDPTSPPSPAFALMLPSMPAQLAPGETLAVPVTYDPAVTTGSAGVDTVVLRAELAGSLDASATTTITGQAVFIEASGGGGCDTGGAGRGGGLVLGLAALALHRRRRRRLAGLATSIAAAVAFAPAARADDIGIAVFHPTPATTGAGFALQAPDVGPDGSWVGSAIASYASNLLELQAVSGDGTRVATSAPVARSTRMQIGGAYALRDRFEIGAHLPIYQQSGESGPTAQAASGTALGNLALHAKARLWRGDTGPGLGTLVAGASATVRIPTASEGQFTGSDQPELRLLALGSFVPSALASRLSIAVNAGAVIRGESEFANITEQSGIAWGLGASYRLLDKLWATAELFGQVTPSGLRQPRAGDAMASATLSQALSQMEWLAGVSFHPEPRVIIGVAIGRGATDAIGTPSFRGVLSLAFTPGAPAHPYAPPSPERDRDGDGDGIVGARDRCPSQPEDSDGWKDGDGCSDPDNDSDSIPDVLDRCPNEPEASNDKDGDGCPDLDNDGIADARDRCPGQPEDGDGWKDGDGCPDPDNDNDGIADARDRCPGEPETINSTDDDDGCPDTADATKAAEQTFTRGRELMQQGQYAAACTQFEQSQKLDPQFGTQYNLAGCYDKIGKLATAWNLYRELSRSDNHPARRAKAGELAAALAGRVPRLNLVLTRKPPGVRVYLNRADASALIGIATPVDLGRYELAATAPGYRAWRKVVDVTQEGKLVTVVIDLTPAH